MSIGKRVREARKLAGLTQKELSVKAGIGQASLSELETGESSSSTSIATLANALGVSAYWLETGKGDRTIGIDQGATLSTWPRMQFVTEEESRLLDAYRCTDDDGREAVMSMAMEQPRVVLPGIAHNKSQG